MVEETLTKTKKRTARETIESTDHGVEHVWAKVPGKEIECIDQEGSNEPDTVLDDKRKLKKYLDKHGETRYTQIHSHDRVYLPSPWELAGFIEDDDRDKMVIVQRDHETGKEMGRLIVRKTEKTEKWGISFMKKFEKEQAAAEFARQSPTGICRTYDRKTPEQLDRESKLFKVTEKYESCRIKIEKGEGRFFDLKASFRDIIEMYNLQVKYIPAKGYTKGFLWPGFIKHQEK
jgi:hypothetical protein